MQLLIAKELKFIVLTAFRYRSAGITDLRLETRLTDDAPVNGRPGQEPATSTGRIGSDAGGARYVAGGVAVAEIARSEGRVRLGV